MPALFRTIVPVKGRGRRTYAEDAAGKIPRLDETCHASVGSGKEPSSEHYRGDAVEPRILWWVSRPYTIESDGNVR